MSRNGRFYAAAACAFALGSFLRLDNLASQILLDDEWHGLNQVISSSLGGVFGGFDARDNTSLPLNLYHWVLLHTAGWSELAIRAPVILAGLAGLAVMPLAARRAAGDRAAIIFAFLLAIAPFAVFYSRFSRAYAVIMLLGFIALAAAHRWLGSGERKAGIAFLTAGTLAAWTHPLAVVVVLVPYILYYGAGFVPRWRTGGREAGPAAEPPAGPAGPFIAVTGADVRKFGLIQAGLLLPAALMTLAAGRALPWGEGSWSASGLADAATLLSGTTNVLLNCLFYIFLIAGIAALHKKNPLFAGMIAALAALYVLVLAASRPLGLGTGVVILRYMIVMLPLSLLAAAAGMDSLAARLMPPGPAVPRAGRAFRFLPPAGFALFVAFLYASGPLPAINAGPNDFTNHSAYQGRYDSPDTLLSDARHVYPGYRASREDIPAFYRDLRGRADVAAVVEYPMDITNYNNLLYFYQMVHGKRVIAGYCPDRTLLGHRVELPPGDDGAPLRLGMLSADQVLSRIPDRKMLKFRNMADVTDPGALAASGAGILILHKQIMALRFLPGGTGAAKAWYRSVPLLAARYAAILGPPLYEDGSIVCFRIGNAYNR